MVNPSAQASTRRSPFCKEKDLIVNEESAEEFVDWKGEQIEAGE